MHTALKVAGATAKVAVIAAAAVKVYVFTRLAYAIAKADTTNTIDDITTGSNN